MTSPCFPDYWFHEFRKYAEYGKRLKITHPVCYRKKMSNETLARERELVLGLERKNAYDHFLVDPYGTHPPLSSKRETRRWDVSCLDIIGERQPDVIKRLLHFCGGDTGSQIFNETLPWHDECEQT
jgi:hypothetical protein